MRATLRSNLLAVGILAAACATVPHETTSDPPADAASALLRRASRFFDGASFDDVGWDAAIDRLARADVVCLGETHLDQLTHDAELELLRALADRRGGKVALSMEMFERDAQPALDDYLAGRMPEAEFLAHARPWRNYPTDYRPLVELAKERGIPVVAANLPADLRTKLSRGGQPAFDALTPVERDRVPAKLIENPPEYWDRVENATRGHGAMGGGAAAPRPSRLFDAQNLWDNTMADAIARSLAREPDRLVVHVVGGFHVDRWQGIVWQLLQRRPGTRVRTVEIGATSDLAGSKPDDVEPRADLLLHVEARSRSEQDGAAAIVLGREQRYRLRFPPDAIPGTKPLPLLVWLADDGATLDEAMQLWDPIVGRECALCVVEPTYPFLGVDGLRRARWSFPGSVDDDGGLAAGAIERLLDVVTRDRPGGRTPALPIDRTRIVLAGERAGGTMALCAARFGDHAPFSALAFAPLAQDEIAQMSLPLPPGRDRPPRALTLMDAEPRADAWREATSRDGELRLTTTVQPLATELPAQERAEVDATRAALGLPPLATSRAADAMLAHAPESPRARALTRVLARRARVLGLAEAPSLAIAPEAFADGSRLPLSSGPFGGTTIVVLADDASDAELAAWSKLEEPDVLQKRSRFHRLRIARGTGERSPLAVIQKLRAENPQRRDFLLVPASFCVGDEQLEQLRGRLGPLADELHLELLPGLGDRLLDVRAQD